MSCSFLLRCRNGDDGYKNQELFFFLMCPIVLLRLHKGRNKKKRWNDNEQYFLTGKKKELFRNRYFVIFMLKNRQLWKYKFLEQLALLWPSGSFFFFYSHLELVLLLISYFPLSVRRLCCSRLARRRDRVEERKGGRLGWLEQPIRSGRVQAPIKTRTPGNIRRSHAILLIFFLIIYNNIIH